MMMKKMMMMVMITSLHDAINAYIGVLFNGLATTFRVSLSLSFTSRLILNGF
jgi:hypothetical protein